ncbi:MAG: chromate transporter [Lachnospiraceae bacterium]|nr:chromate transporter [Lachnospiraceae bacterium]
MKLLLMMWHFFKTGLFAFGGGLATVPFLYEISDATGWFTHQDILDMLAVSESTPGPIGVNMATFTGFKSFGVFGGICATLALILPSFLVIMLIARLLKKFQDNRFVKGSFYILRPASTALISAAGFNIILAVFFDAEKITFDMFGQLGEMFTHINWIPIVIFAVVFVLMRIFKKLHPIVFIAACAALGIILKL